MSMTGLQVVQIFRTIHIYIESNSLINEHLQESRSFDQKKKFDKCLGKILEFRLLYNYTYVNHYQCLAGRPSSNLSKLCLRKAYNAVSVQYK